MRAGSKNRPHSHNQEGFDLLSAGRLGKDRKPSVEESLAGKLSFGNALNHLTGNG